MKARTLDEILAEMSPERRARIEARKQEMIAEVDSLRAVRKLAGMTQAQIASALGKKQPSVQKMERQADYFVSTLRRFVEAAGGSVAAGASSGALGCLMNTCAATMPTSYRMHIGIASASCEITSGGVTTAAMMKLATTK